MREMREEANAGDRYYAAMAGVAPQNQQVIAPKREIVNRSDPSELEGAVMKEVGELLAMHPQIVFAVRQNTGATTDYVWFYRWVKWPEKMTISDYWGLQRNRRMFAIECKRRNWKYTGSEREQQQKAFIDTVVESGGRGGFATCAEEAREILAG